MPAFSEAFHADFGAGPLRQRFCIWHADPGVAPAGLVVHVHAFTEEMNKSRRMVAMQARALAGAGFAVLRFDLLGCGDSAGEFSDATLDAWLDDVLAAVVVARQRFSQTWPEKPQAPLWLWGQRAGALLATEAASRLAEHVNLLLWQPTPNGKSVLQQFLRLESVGALLGKDTARGNARALLAQGQVAEVAGYCIAPGLANGLEALRLQAPARTARLEWLDMAATADRGPSPAAQAVLQAWASAGWQTRHQSVFGPSFWQTTEIEDVPALLPATVAALLSPSGAPMAADSQQWAAA